MKVPVISECFANLECRVKQTVEEKQGNHLIFMAEVVGFKMNEKLKPLVWLNNQYFKVGAECKV